ncbi:MAG TPA: DUF1631 family protein [Pseudomonadales bacterium]
MGPGRDPGNVFTAMHHKATGELLHLMDGLYMNIEDGLFEFAYRHEDDEAKQRACFDLMRELRYRRSNLIQSFAKRMQRGLGYWLEDKQEFDTEYDVHLDQVAQRMSEKCAAHFSFLLGQIAERTATASGRDPAAVRIPIAPYQIAYNFLATCRSLDLDNEAIDIVQNLFERFVLDRLGNVYGECNRRLEEAGFDVAPSEGEMIYSA